MLLRRLRERGIEEKYSRGKVSGGKRGVIREEGHRIAFSVKYLSEK